MFPLCVCVCVCVVGEEGWGGRGALLRDMAFPVYVHLYAFVVVVFFYNGNDEEIIEPAHEKTYNAVVMTSKDSDQPAHPPSIQYGKGSLLSFLE